MSVRCFGLRSCFDRVPDFRAVPPCDAYHFDTVRRTRYPFEYQGRREAEMYPLNLNRIMPAEGGTGQFAHRP